MVLGVYVGGQAAATDDVGLSRTGGWALYARVARFADCDRFRPPAGTDGLCQPDVPPRARSGATFYFHISQSPAWRVFGPPPAGSSTTSSARSPSRPSSTSRSITRGSSGRTSSATSIPTSAPPCPSRAPARTDSGSVHENTLYEPQARAAVAAYWRPVEPRRGAVELLSDYQRVVRVHGPLLPLLLIVAIAGLVPAPRRVRAGIVLLGGAAILVMVVPAATLLYGMALRGARVAGARGRGDTRGLGARGRAALPGGGCCSARVHLRVAGHHVSDESIESRAALRANQRRWPRAAPCPPPSPAGSRRPDPLGRRRGRRTRSRPRRPAPPRRCRAPPPPRSGWPWRRPPPRPARNPRGSKAAPCRARRRAPSPPRRRHEAGHLHDASSPCSARAPRAPRPVGAVAVDLPAQLRALARERERRHQRPARASPGCAVRRRPRTGSAAPGLVRPRAARRTRPRAPSTPPRSPPREAAPRAAARSRTPAGARAAQSACTACRRARRAAEVLAPVVAAPDLVPVDHQPEAAQPRTTRRGEQREVRERGRVHHVVAAAAAQQVPEHAGAEHERGQHPPPARARVELHPRPRPRHAHARDSRRCRRAATAAASGR